MRFPLPGRHPDAASFREHIAGLAPGFHCEPTQEDRRGPLGQPLEVLGRALSNRFAIHPMEGWDGTPDGGPSEWTLRRWRRFGASGAALVWGGEAVAVRADGRANPNQLCLDTGANPARTLEALREAVGEGVREAGEEGTTPLLGLQLTHSGRFARPTGEQRPRVAVHHPILDPRTGVAADEVLLSDGELEEIAAGYLEGARLAREAGFDFVDVKCCHGYLLHELLGARARPGPYGGSLENRARLVLGIVDEIRRQLPGFGIGVRLSVGDVYPFRLDEGTGSGAPLGWDAELPFEHGFGLDSMDPRRMDLGEAATLLGWLAERDVTLVNVTLGSPYWCPHLQRPAAYPPSDGYPPPEDPLLGVYAQIEAVRALRAARPDAVLVGSGYTYLQEYLPHVAQHEVRAGHVDFVGLGRMVLSYPELPRDVLAGRPLDRKRLCRTFSDCTNAPRAGLASGCYPLDADYRARPEAAVLREHKRSGRSAH